MFGNRDEILLGRLQRRVLGIERQIEEERPLLVLLDPIARPLGIRVGRVEVRIVHRLHVGADPRVDKVRRIEERRVGHRAKELVEAPFRRDKLRRSAEMPLADARSVVSQILQPIGDRRFRHRQPKRGVTRSAAAVEFVAEPRRIPPGHQPRPARAAIRRGDIPLREANAGRRDRVDMRRRNLLVPLTAELAVSFVVGEENDDVGPLGIGPLGRQRSSSHGRQRTQERENGTQRSHNKSPGHEKGE